MKKLKRLVPLTKVNRVSRLCFDNQDHIMISKEKFLLELKHIGGVLNMYDVN